MSKRTGDGDSETSQKRPRVQDGRFLDGLTFYLHPAALSKVRRAIFEKQIPKHGGELVTDIAKVVGSELNILIEDSAAERAHAIIESSKKLVKPACAIKFTRMTWLSQCLEATTLIDREPFDLDRSKEPKKGNISPSNAIGGSSDPPGQTKSYIDRNRHKFVCAKSSAQSSPADPAQCNPNKAITDELEKLAAAYKATSDTWRAFGYQKAISALKNCGKAIRTREEAASLPGVGAKMADKGGNT